MRCRVDRQRRARIVPNHTFTHVLNLALKQHLGDHIDQKGSIVLPDKLRFDFSHGGTIAPKQLKVKPSVHETQLKLLTSTFTPYYCCLMACALHATSLACPRPVSRRCMNSISVIKPSLMTSSFMSKCDRRSAKCRPDTKQTFPLTGH